LPQGVNAQRTEWLMRYGAWLRLLARLEIDSRFQGKFSAADVVQQTLFEAWRCWEQFRGSSEAERLAWLRGILAHQLAHLARHYAATKKRAVAREVSIEDSLRQSAQRLADMLPARDATPSAIAEARDEQLWLANILERLPREYSDVIVLRHLEGLSHAEIARRLERSEGAVRMLWVRALARLQDEVRKG
jgi:RNA polymerase sigma-70 factor (ECF subfamily)